MGGLGQRVSSFLERTGVFGWTRKAVMSFVAAVLHSSTMPPTTDAPQQPSSLQEYAKKIEDRACEEVRRGNLRRDVVPHLTCRGFPGGREEAGRASNGGRPNQLISNAFNNEVRAFPDYSHQSQVARMHELEQKHFSDWLSEDPDRVTIAAINILENINRSSSVDERELALRAYLEDIGITAEDFVSKSLAMSNITLHDMYGRINHVAGDIGSKRMPESDRRQLNANIVTATCAIQLQLDLLELYPRLTGMTESEKKHLEEERDRLSELRKNIPSYPPQPPFILERVP